MAKARMTSPFYVPERDGSPAEYINFCRDNGIVALLFHGYEQFLMLWNQGFLTPFISSIRLMAPMGGPDQHYFVIDENTLEGVELRVHAGLPGRHSARELLERGWNFEADSLNPSAVRKK